MKQTFIIALSLFQYTEVDSEIQGTRGRKIQYAETQISCVLSEILHLSTSFLEA